MQVFGKTLSRHSEQLENAAGKKWIIHDTGHLSFLFEKIPLKIFSWCADLSRDGVINIRSLS